MISFDLEEPVEFSNLPGVAAPDYADWLERGRAMAEAHHANQWNVGDWLVEGAEHFDAKDVIGDLPGYMRMFQKKDGTGYASVKFPNFYQDAADALGFAVQTLKNLARVARAFPPRVRIPQLTFAHHAEAAGYDRAMEYLEACLGEAKPHTVAWLRKHIDEKEGRVDREEVGRYLYLKIPEGIYGKLKDLGRHYDINISDLVEKSCLKAIDAYIAGEAKRISLKLFDFYEAGRWPLAKDVIEQERKKIKARRRYRINNDPVFGEKRRQASLVRWNRNQKVA